MTLVVVHRDHKVEVSPHCAEEQRIRRQRAVDLPAPRSTRLDPGGDLALFLPAAKEPVFPGVRVDPADSDARVRYAGIDQHGPSTRDRALDQPGIDALHCVQDADMRGHVNHPQFRRHQQHRNLLGAREFGE